MLCGEGSNSNPPGSFNQYRTSLTLFVNSIIRLLVIHIDLSKMDLSIMDDQS